jgi:hypothetical protein
MDSFDKDKHFLKFIELSLLMEDKLIHLCILKYFVIIIWLPFGNILLCSQFHKIFKIFSQIIMPDGQLSIQLLLNFQFLFILTFNQQNLIFE